MDYLVNEKTGEIVEGDKEDKDLETVWTILIQDGQWKLTMIEESSLSLEYAKMKNDIEVAGEHLKMGFKYKNQIYD